MEEYELPTNQIICGDSALVLKTFPDNCIPLTICSPPYDKLRANNEYKAEFDFETIAKELLRVTKPGGVLVWVVGNMVLPHGQGETDTAEQQIINFKRFGWIKHDTMIYVKDSRYPEKTRYRQAWEYMIVFSKGEPVVKNLLKDHKTVSYYNHKWRKNHAGNRQEDGEIKAHNDYEVQPFATRENVWFYHNGYLKTTPDKIAYEHPAIFPDKLAQDHIKSWSNEGDIVLDCFAGSGTTLKAAAKLRRKYIGIEKSQEYIEIAKKRLEIITENEEMTQWW